MSESQDTTWSARGMEKDILLEEEMNELFWDFFRELDLDESEQRKINMLNESNKVKYLESTGMFDSELIENISDITESAKRFTIQYGFGECTKENWGKAVEASQEVNSKIYETRQMLILGTLTGKNKEQINNFIHTNMIPPIIWQGKQADLARIYKDLFKAGLITVSGRDFSKHFTRSNGEPMPVDFQESKGTGQDAFSPKQEIAAIQRKIRDMKPESGE